MNGWEASSFPLPRLMSEYGVQSLPSYSTLSEVYQFPEDADIFSPLNEHRQHHGNGNQEIIDEILNNLNLPNLTDRIENFKSIIYLSQINQAMTLKTGTEVFRRLRDTLDTVTGFGRCMGTMYWQFNDLWQAPTWSSIEYVSSIKYNLYGYKWKMSHYFIKNAYSKILISPVINSQTNTLDIYAISDHADKMVDSSFNMKIFSYDSFTPKLNEKINFKIDPLKSKIVQSISLNEIEQKTKCKINTSDSSCMILLDSDDASIQNGNKNFLFMNNRLTDVKTIKTPKLSIIDVKKLDKGLFEIEIKSDVIALFVWLDISENKFFGVFSDNGFHMTSDNQKVTYQTDNLSIEVDDIKKYISITSLANAFQDTPKPFINSTSKPILNYLLACLLTGLMFFNLI